MRTELYDDKDTDPPALEPIAWPSAAWRAAFAAQLTAATLDRVGRHARALIRGLDGLICASVADDLVQDAVVATQQGSAAWRPERVALRRHLADHVAAALDRLRDRVERFESVDALIAPGDEAAEDGAESTPFEHAHLSVTPDVERELEVKRVAREAEVAVWRRFADDQRAMTVINCFAVGITDTATIAAHAGWTRPEVDTVRKRIARGLEDLSSPLQQRIQALLS